MSDCEKIERLTDYLVRICRDYTNGNRLTIIPTDILVWYQTYKQELEKKNLRLKKFQENQKLAKFERYIKLKQELGL